MPGSAQNLHPPFNTVWLGQVEHRVTDLAASRAFYVDILGMQISHEDTAYHHRPARPEEHNRPCRNYRAFSGAEQYLDRLFPPGARSGSGTDPLVADRSAASDPLGGSGPEKRVRGRVLLRRRRTDANQPEGTTYYCALRANEESADEME
ncbi:hypothetical protein SAMN04488239_103342 [Ruegeria marina]|uniref:Glyoxalase/fosfomycin resistance/dioxygenase domain-containing protein n=1 Tax=Ruegeria marina TaxID=639004 RepID=A0A1G6P9E3_9RHOB|nr:hypothetical protein SAMN04488239_103342 [Ruegeria marina]